MTSTSLLGREADIAELAKLLTEPGVRLVTLTGPGGIGKTRLAVAVAEALDERGGHRTVFVPLASLTDAASVLPRVVEVVGATVDGARSPLDVIAEHLAGTPTVLVLDNLEQVIDVAPQLDELLARCPSLQILATSRRVLRLRAEREYQVAALTVPTFADVPTTEELASLPAVQLFVDRARAVRYDFELTPDNASAIAEIGRRLDGLPLAIELAAARTRLLTPVSLLDRLGSRLDALGTGPVDLPERQRTLRATVEWSIDLLDDAERQMLAALSVFVEGWTLEAAMDVTDLTEDRTLDLLDALAGHSLVSVDAAAAGPRFRMLTSVRELAAELLAASGDLADVQRRHAAHFRAVVEAADWPSERQVEWAERLRTDEQNLRAAVRWYLANDVAPLPHVFRILWLFWQMRGRMPEGRAWIAEVQRRADTLDDRSRAELLFTSAITAVEVGDDDIALASLDELRRLDGRVDDAYLASAVRLAISWILPLVDDERGALAAATAAIEGFRRLDEPFVAFAGLTAGIVLLSLGDIEAARAHLREVDELGGRFGNSWLRSAARSQLAIVAVAAGHVDEARAFVIGSLDVGDAAEPSTLTLTFSLVAAAHLASAQGDPRRAALALAAAEGLRRRAGLKAWPTMRRSETELVARVAQGMDGAELDAARNAGAQLGHREAVALLQE